LKFDGAAFKNLEGLNVGIPDFLPLKYCRERHASEQDNGNHLILGHNPLKSCYDQGEHLNPWAVYEDEFDELRILEQNSSSKEQEDIGGGGVI